MAFCRQPTLRNDFFRVTLVDGSSTERVTLDLSIQFDCDGRTAVLALVVSLDGDGATTYLVVTAAMLPLYTRLGMNPLMLACVLMMAGGVMNIAEEPHGYDRARAYGRIRGIHDTVLRIFERADADGTTTAAAANRLAEERIAAVSRVRLLRAGH